ncbi:insulinase family protein [Alginatibacterium sediminis]|uniref:insulinase family protein n=1 Tax=Alginatibacterium sediminis TaxID=2164068 RepID=UPI0018F747EA|nr:insulinase family protein [Alginatibacterium sediminis]
MLKSPNDAKRYQHFELHNGLKVLVIEDASSQLAAASLLVNVGHFQDPSDRPGLAHFLEHMLFLGTSAYPIPGEYQSFIDRHGGSHNAWTGPEQTNYFFDIEPQWFEQALQRFSQFFIAPLFIPELVDQERQAVDSEFKLKYQDDLRRSYDVHKATINPEHDFSKFSVGNLETLANSEQRPIRDELITFYEEQYSSDRMTLVVLAPQLISKTRAMVEALFSPISKISWTPKIQAPMYLDEHLGQQIHIQSLRDLNKLSLSFGFDDMRQHYRSKPLTFISHLVGYEGQGSLVSSLRERGLINSMAAGGGVNGVGFRDFNIVYSLTEHGTEQIDYIVAQTFAYLNLIQEQGLVHWRYLEKQQVHERAFLYQEESNALDTVTHLSANMGLYEESDIIYGDYVMDCFDPELISTCLSQMKPSRLRLSLSGPNVKCDQESPWYACPYQIQTIAADRLNAWEQPSLASDVYLPAVNPFIQHSQAPLEKIVEHFSGKPVCIRDDAGFRLWFCQEPQFDMPKGHIYASLDSSLTVASQSNIVRTRLALELFLDHLSQLTYQAEIAGINYHIYAHQGGYTLHISGFSEKQALLLKMVLGNRTFGQFNPQRFEIIKQQLIRRWENQSKAKPISQLFRQLTSLLQPNNLPPQLMAELVKDVQLNELKEFVKRVYSKVHLEVMVYGNWSLRQATAMADFIGEEIVKENGKAAMETPRPLVNIQRTGSLRYPISCPHPDHAMIIYYQSPSTSARQMALFTFCNHLMSSTFFNELRTKQQLGYIVGTDNLPLNRHPGLMFYVQSPHASSEQLADAIDAFLDVFPILMFELSHEKWEQSKAGLISQVLDKESNMQSRAQRYWVSIGNKDWEFDHRQQIAQWIEQLERRDLVHFMMTLKNKQRDRIIVYTADKDTDSHAAFEKGELIEDRRVFQTQRARFYAH